MSDINEKLAKLSKLDKRAVKSLTKKWKDKKTGQEKSFVVSYVTARTVMNMLDTVIGPANWYATYEPFAGGSVQCTLYLRIDGEWIGKSDVGTPSDIEPEKGAVSDAFKRAAVHWGIARELYNEGTATFETDDNDDYAPEPVHDRARETMTDDGDPATDLEAITWTRDVVALDKFIAFARKEWATEGEKPMTFPHLANRLIKALSLDGTAANRAELDALLEVYPGSKQDAAESVRTYVSQSDVS